MSDYWSKAQEAAISEWQKETDQKKKNNIYQNKLHKFIEQIIDGVITKSYTDRENIKDIRQDLFMHIWTILPQIDLSRGRAFSYITKSAQNRVILLSGKEKKYRHVMSDYKTWKTTLKETEMSEEEKIIDNPDGRSRNADNLLDEIKTIVYASGSVQASKHYSKRGKYSSRVRTLMDVAFTGALGIPANKRVKKPANLNARIDSDDNMRLHEILYHKGITIQDFIRGTVVGVISGSISL